jgi:hypothetical protein
VDRPDGGGKTLDKVPVVDDRQHRPLKGQHSLLELGPAGDIEVIDRLVEQ